MATVGDLSIYDLEPVGGGILASQLPHGSKMAVAVLAIAATLLNRKDGMKRAKMHMIVQSPCHSVISISTFISVIFC